MIEYDDGEFEDDDEFSRPDILDIRSVEVPQEPDRRREQLRGVGLENRAYFTGLAALAAREAEAGAARLAVMEERLVLLDRMLRISHRRCLGSWDYGGGGARGMTRIACRCW